MATNEHSGYPLKWFKDQNTVRNAYECAICLDVLEDAVQVQACGHQFCALCVDDILKVDPHCPSCRIIISNEKIFEDHAARRLIRQLNVNCCNEGCSWHGTLSSLLQDHQNKCNFLINHNDHQSKVEELEQNLTTLFLAVSALEEKHDKDIKELKLKYEQDVNELKVKLQLSENRLKRLEEKEKAHNEGGRNYAGVGEDIVLPSEQIFAHDMVVKKEEEESGAAHPRRLKYERDFLLQFQFQPVCMRKPASLPDVEIVLDAPNIPNKSSESPWSTERGQTKRERRRKARCEGAVDIPLWPEPKQEQNFSNLNLKSQVTESQQPSLQKAAEPSKRKSSKQRFKDLNKKETDDLMGVYTEKPTPQMSSQETNHSFSTQSDEPTAVMMQQRQGGYIHPMSVPRPMRPNRTIYSSSPQGPSQLQGFIQPQGVRYQVVSQVAPSGERKVNVTDEKTESIEKRQHLVEDPFGGKQFQKEMVTSANDYSDTGSENDPYGQQQMMRAYMPNVQTAYQMPPASAQLTQPFIPQHQYSNQGVPTAAMYYTSVQTNNINKPKPKRTSKIRILDPKDLSDVTDKILHSSSGSTATAQTESSTIQAQFAGQVAARVAEKAERVMKRK